MTENDFQESNFLSWSFFFQIVIALIIKIYQIIGTDRNTKRPRKKRERKESESACMHASNFSSFVKFVDKEKLRLMGTARSDMIYNGYKNFHQKLFCIFSQIGNLTINLK